jgi:signal peptidase I
MNDVAPALELPSAAELAAIAELWKRERRKFTTSFGGTSMMPTIAPGQQVVVECGRDPVVGDVVVFRSDDRIMVHRLTASAGNWLLTWGDANWLPDEPVDSSHVVGVVPGVASGPTTFLRLVVPSVFATWLCPVDRLGPRMRFAYRVEWLWRQGIPVFAGTAFKALRRRLSAN